ncbi:MAG: alpha/beta hydrolase [Succinivibrio sp.]|nr:alpha/beta hydrolase [Succinivibrio sp.]
MEEMSTQEKSSQPKAESENLSEILFKPHFNYQETSQISNSGVELKLGEDAHRLFRHLEYDARWYRMVHVFSWTWQGGSLLDIDDALCHIAASTAPRSREQCLDTVREYGPGNWIYEFNTQAQKRFVKARKLEEEGRLKEASHNYRMASRYYAIASFPKLRSDLQAADSYMQALRLYRKMFDCDASFGTLQELELNTEKGKVSGFLHLPCKDKVCPCLVICGSYEHALTDFYRFYRDYLFPRGIAVLVVELPGLGVSEKLSLTYNTSIVLDAALKELGSLSCIDAHKISLLGIRLGGTACLRCALTNPDRVAALCLIEPGVDSMFTDKALLNALPLSMRSLYANRLNLDASQWENVIPQLSILSLKRQGLMQQSTPLKLPVMLDVVKDAFTSRADVELIAHNFAQLTLNQHENAEYNEFIFRALIKIPDFLCSALGLEPKAGAEH